MERTRFSLPLKTPLNTAAGGIAAREGFLVRVTVDGVSGLGEATPLPGWTESLDACEIALNAVRPAVESEKVDEAIAALSENPAARHGLSLAVADARAQATDQPLYRFLGGEMRVETIPVNATIGAGTVRETVEAAEQAVADGFRTLKLKVGADTVAADVERVAAVRAAVGEQIELRADANGAWDVPTAKRAIDGFEKATLSMLEQPLPATHLKEHARFRGGDVRIGLDESLTERTIAEILDAEAADVLVLKPMALGGVDVAREAAVAAREAGVDCIVTTTIDGAVARAAAVHLAASLQDVAACGLATASFLAADVAESDPVPVTDGTIAVPQGKGNVHPVLSGL
ncbi:enolase C-terminal domain-like protein [Haladaptatus sp. DJG-WS-42]|uniref:mandelate racemase/muconate lactonizing enzyme family protein n=1 Tax=Haladaptatus sp. DJG-WS-42 TaxID=3120516 RepID=UPI0030CC80DF